MKLHQILEARTIGDNRPVYYYEYYPHHMGTIVSKGELPLGKFDDIARLTDKQITDGRDVFGFRQYALFNIIRTWPKVREELIKTGKWLDDWEEGSHSLSLNSPEQAYLILKQHEKDHDFEDGQYNEEDWE